MPTYRALRNEGLELKNGGRYHDALILFEQGIEQVEKNITKRTRLLELRFQKGLCPQGIGKLREAEIYHKHSLQMSAEQHHKEAIALRTKIRLELLRILGILDSHETKFSIPIYEEQIAILEIAWDEMATLDGGCNNDRLAVLELLAGTCAILGQQSAEIQDTNGSKAFDLMAATYGEKLF